MAVGLLRTRAPDLRRSDMYNRRSESEYRVYPASLYGPGVYAEYMAGGADVSSGESDL